MFKFNFCYLINYLRNLNHITIQYWNLKNLMILLNRFPKIRTVGGRMFKICCFKLLLHRNTFHKVQIQVWCNVYVNETNYKVCMIHQTFELSKFDTILLTLNLKISHAKLTNVNIRAWEFSFLMSFDFSCVL